MFHFIESYSGRVGLLVGGERDGCLLKTGVPVGVVVGADVVIVSCVYSSQPESSSSSQLSLSSPCTGNALVFPQRE